MYSLSYDTKLKLKDLFVCLAEEEVRIERLRQVLASIPDFEPYAAFKRIDRLSNGVISCSNIAKYLKENGYREVTKDDMQYMVRYFDQDDDMKLSYHEQVQQIHNFGSFLQILLPCDNAALRADASQRPTFKIGKNDILPVRVEQAMTTLLLKEVKLQIKAENIKRILEQSYDFNIQSAYKVIDDWSYGFLDARNLRRFLRNMGVLLGKNELVALIRRIDLDGDAKISYEEFFEGVRSQFAQSNKIGHGMRSKGILSSQNGNTKSMGRSHSRTDIIQNSPNKKTSKTTLTPIRIKCQTAKPCQKRPKSAQKVTIRAKRLQRNFAQPTCQCEHHIHNMVTVSRQQTRDNETFNNDDLEDSPSRSINKSVTFNNQVRVREYESLQARKQLARMEEERKQSHSPSPTRSSYHQAICHNDPYAPILSQSPLRQKAITSINFNEQQSSINHTYMSPQIMIPERVSHVTSPLRASHSSPLKAIDLSSRPLHYNYSPDKSRRADFSTMIDIAESGHASEYGDRFDRIEQEECHKLFKDIIFLERELESSKIELTLKPDFNLLDAFRQIDCTNNGFVTYQELSENLTRVFEIDVLSLSGMENLELFFCRYDANKDGRISLAEFCKAFTPCGKEYAALVQGRAEFYAKKGINPREFFNTDTRRQVKSLWQNLLFTERSLENVRLRIFKRSLFNLRSAFNYCDKDENGAITPVDMREMLSQHGFFATEKELGLIMNKFDKFNDQKITLTDFIDEITPKLRR